jgi:C4-dicarboxylate-specific signal transduction histidine kinase
LTREPNELVNGPTILITLGVLLLQSGTIVSLLLERRKWRCTQATLCQREARTAEPRSRLVQFGRVALVGELLAALADETKQPLAAILANARAARRMLEIGQLDSCELGKILEDIARDGLRASAIIDHRRTRLRPGDAEPELLSLNEVVSEVLELMRGELHYRRVIVSPRLLEPSPWVLADRVELQQVLWNLVLNACDAMGERCPAERVAVVSTARNGEEVCIEVRDQGCGIRPDALTSIFEPFVTTKREGAGLGLAVCRTIVTESRGRIWAANNPDRGATVRVSLPLAATLDPMPRRFPAAMNWS